MSNEFKQLSTTQAIQYESEYAAHNYHPLPVVFSKAQGCVINDPEGKSYLDFLSAYSAVNQGHCNPRIINALIDQAKNLTLSSRAFYNDVFPVFASKITSLTGFECVLPMNTGAEAVETSFKLVRKYGYEVKKIPQDKAIIIGARGCFHGRTLGALSLSDDPQATDGFGPLVPGFVSLEYGNYNQYKEFLESDKGKYVTAILLEPIQGEAGVVVPPLDFWPKITELCRKHDVLLIADEIQTGLGRTGKLMCWQNYTTEKPDVVLLGKALSGGTLPVSCVLSSKKIMNVFTPGTHGSTFGGSALASRVAIESLNVIIDDHLIENSEKLGKIFKNQLSVIQKNDANNIITEIRGMGLLMAIVIDSKKANNRTAWDLCLLLKENGLLAKPTHDNIIRLAPPLIVTEKQILEASVIIEKCLKLLPNVPISGD
ncbi:hypothetical protein TBLA_0G02160 [Henningerozyma blattae CBS 6284]|uniref:Ornithine aminotransferase n=1 Tax=Henningerozyma blattae (strain ATCC 34711 / CBS 6284 / DSM 70876 / NBRC 10599 / NRRL Y-10934 / UCD 77-7) TaxID=1071380 RepID=I2H705_HENB6|nr:hypothetical protein TBLA_0G02160 [Tetrapisispora blattae CBS 6284]CCH62157.1 hypothetical protein TBLA_0G02160 [Tetrapisispora blattae CBS 6284]